MQKSLLKFSYQHRLCESLDSTITPTITLRIPHSAYPLSLPTCSPLEQQSRTL